MKNTNYTFRKIPLLSLFGMLSLNGYSQVFTETIGTGTATVSIAAHESANGFDNDGFTMSGTADVRASGVSTGYSGASGGKHVYFAPSQQKTFEISGINSSGLGCVDLSFGIYKSTIGANGSSFSIYYSSDGINYFLKSISLSTGNNTDVWVLKTITGLPAVPNLRLRFVAAAVNGLTIKLDDIKLISTPQVAGTIAISDATLCAGGTTSLIGNTAANTTYQWEQSTNATVWNPINGATNGASLGISPASSMYYRRVDTGVCGSANTNVVQVTVVADPVLQFTSSDVMCFNGNDGSASASISGGIGPMSYAYNWTPGNPQGDGTAAISQLSAGEYTLNATGSLGCNAQNSVTIGQPTELLAASVSDTILCFGDSATITVSASGGVAPYSGIGEFVVAAGSYSYTVTDANGCSAVTTIIISEPAKLVLDVSASDYNGFGVSCFGDANGSASADVSGGTPGYSYIWDNGAMTAGISSLAAGVYYCSVTDTNGCSASDSVVITEPTQVTISAIYDEEVFCHGDSTDVSIQTSGGVLDYSVNDAGVYTVPAGSYSYSIVDANGCSASVEVEISEPEALTIVAGNDGVVYFGYEPMECFTIDAVADGGTPGYTYSWSSVNSGSGTGSSVNACPDANEVYTLSVEDANGCIASDDVSICVIDVQCEAGQSKNMKVEMCQIPPGNPANAHTICIDASAVPAHLAIGCQLGSCGEAESACLTAARSLTANETPTRTVALSVFPNPADDKISISFTPVKSGTYNVMMYDLLGNEVMNIFNGTSAEFENRVIEVTTSALARGVYLVTVSNGSQTIESLRVIKQ